MAAVSQVTCQDHDVVEALAWGLLASTTLVIGACVVMVRDPSTKVLGLVMGFGSGVLVSSVSFEMIEEAADVSPGGTAIGFFAGALVFVGGDTILARVGGRQHDASRPAQPSRSAAGLPIVLGSVLDGIPESAALGLSLLEGGGVGLAILAAVFVSNLPESMAASSELLEGGWSRQRVL
ncbi:MAG: ZIP family metal transporter [Ilumatobacteraceae bacterium]